MSSLINKAKEAAQNMKGNGGDSNFSSGPSNADATTGNMQTTGGTPREMEADQKINAGQSF